MTDETNHERRTFTRVAVHHVVRLCDASGEIIHEGRLSDVSLGGVLVEGAAQEIAVGTPVRVSIELDASSGAVIETTGHVARSEPELVGVAFDEVTDPTSLAHLRNLILYNSQTTEVVEAEIREHPGISRSRWPS